MTSLNIFRTKVGFELALSWVGTSTSGTLLSWMPNYALERSVTPISECRPGHVQLPTRTLGRTFHVGHVLTN